MLLSTALVEEKEFYVSLQEVGKDALTAEYQMILPVGTFYSNMYGKIELTEKFVDELVINYKSQVLGNRMPFIDTEHDMGEANGWILDLERKADGLYAKIEWTDRGKALVSKSLYRYFSAHYGEVLDVKTGVPISPVLFGAALTNRPVMNTMPPAHLSEGTSSAHRDRERLKGRETRMTKLAEILAALFGLPPEELAKVSAEDKTKITTTLSIQATEDTKLSAKVTEMEGALGTEKQRVETLLAENTAKTKEIGELRTKVAKYESSEVIEKALAEGKILPANRANWEKLFAADPIGTKELLATQPPVIDLKKRGTGDQGSQDTALSAEEEQGFKYFWQGHRELSEKDAREQYTKSVRK